MAITFETDVSDPSRTATDMVAGDEVIFKCADNEFYTVEGTFSAAGEAQVFYTTADAQPSSFDDMAQDPAGSYAVNTAREVHAAKWVGVKVISGTVTATVNRTYVRSA